MKNHFMSYPTFNIAAQSQCRSVSLWVYFINQNIKEFRFFAIEGDIQFNIKMTPAYFQAVSYLTVSGILNALSPLKNL